MAKREFDENLMKINVKKGAMLLIGMVGGNQNPSGRLWLHSRIFITLGPL